MNYRSIADLNRDIQDWISSLPSDIGIVVGVPRSGLLVANILALHLNLPLADVDSFASGISFRGGERCPDWDQSKKVLIVDDSVFTGRQLHEVKSKLYQASADWDVLFGAMYVTSQAKNLLDLYFHIVDFPRIFEWNLLHSTLLSNCCLEIDGVICRACTWVSEPSVLRNARAIHIPSKPIGWLITSRPEKYRKVTEEWLQEILSNVVDGCRTHP